MKIEELISRDYELTGNDRWMHGVEHDSLVIDVKKQLWFWNSRGSEYVGDKYAWLTKVKNLTPAQAKEFLRVNDSNNLYSFIHNIKDTTETVVYPKLVDIFYELGINAPKDYWYSRGINDSTIHRFQLGFHNDWYMIPFYQDGLFKDFQMRRDVPKKSVLHYYKNVGRLLFNSDILRILDSVIITEGPTDCLRLSQEGLPAISHNAGSGGWDESWFKYFIHQKKITVVYDNDEAGRQGARAIAENLGVYRTKIYTFDGFDEKYDVVEFFRNGGTIDELKKLVYNESKYLFELPERSRKNYYGFKKG